MTVTPLARPDDENQLRATVRAGHAASGTDVVYGGLSCAGGVRLTSFVGARTRGLTGLLVRPGWGLGGKVSTEQRPAMIVDYAADNSITHDYDRPVLREGIRSVVAVPVLVGEQTRGLLYAAVRSDAPVSERVVDVMMGLARRLADRLQIDDEVDTRLRLLGACSPGSATASPEDVRDVYRELRVIAQQVGDPVVRRRLLQATQRLVGAPSVPDQQQLLTHREIDVLAEVALGCSNRDVADRLALATETVKAYLRSASQKLGTSNRFQAVSEARRRGLLP